MRIDNQALKTVGEYIYNNFDWITSTADTKLYEDYVSDLIVTTSANTKQNIEVKTIRNGKRPYRGRTLKLDDEESWNNGNFWYINKTDKYGNENNSKWYKFLHHYYDGLIYYFEQEQEIIYYDYPTLMDAYLGDCHLLQPHTTELKDRQFQWETKVMIDTTKGEHYNLNNNNTNN